MIKCHYLAGGILLTLIAGTAFPMATSATTVRPVETVVTDTRPSLADLQATVEELESIGSYHEYFIAQTLTLDKDTPFYAEYRYLNKLVTQAEYLIAYYDQMPTELLQDAISANKTAARSCNLLLNSKTETVTVTLKSDDEKSTQATETTNSSSKTPSTTQTTAKSSSTVTPKPSSTKTTAPKTNQVIAQESTTTAPAAADTEPNQPDASTTDQSTEKIAVPATGEVTSSESKKSPLPLFVAIIAGAAAASIIIAAVLHRQPKSRSRRF